jgi:hypothetical protein
MRGAGGILRRSATSWLPHAGTLAQLPLLRARGALFFSSSPSALHAPRLVPPRRGVCIAASPCLFSGPLSAEVARRHEPGGLRVDPVPAALTAPQL